MSSQLKILVVTNMYPDMNNPFKGVFVKEQVEALRESGVQIDVFNMMKSNSKLNYLLGMFRVLGKTISGRYDLVHTHYGLSAFFSILRFRTPLIITFHGSDININWQRYFARIAHMFARKSIFVSRDLASFFNFKKAEIIPCGVNTKVFYKRTKKECRTKLNFVPDKKYICFPASKGNYIKNYPLFKQTLDQLDENYQEVVLEGYSRNKLAVLLNACDAMLMTSITEGSPVIVKEALACNLPVVSVDVGDVKDIINGNAGCFIVRRDANQLAQAIKKAVNVSDECDYSSSVKKYSNENIARKIRKLYISIL